jgi:phage/conjugal plasmid C-4 type zinc finger TraR family protein
MDDFDRAQAIELAEYERRQAASIQVRPWRASAYRCVECDDTIPEARRVAQPGVQRCVGCQTFFEHQQHARTRG